MSGLDERPCIALTNDAEVFGETVSYEDTSAVDKEAKLLVHDLQRCQRMSRQAGVQVSDCSYPCEFLVPKSSPSR